MWKVIVIICAFGYECQLLEQNPMEYYHDYNECIVVSIEKEKLLTQLYRDFFNEMPKPGTLMARCKRADTVS